jgi:hypothetical protein
LSVKPLRRGHLGSWSALVRELGGGLWTQAMGRNDGDAVAACRRSQHRLDERYEKALKLAWPSDLSKIAY